MSIARAIFLGTYGLNISARFAWLCLDENQMIWFMQVILMLYYYLRYLRSIYNLCLVTEKANSGEVNLQAPFLPLTPMTIKLSF